MSAADARAADREAGRQKLDAFRAAKAAKVIETSAKSDASAASDSTKPDEKSNDDAQALRAKLVKAVSKGKKIEAERDAAREALASVEAELEALRASAGGRDDAGDVARARDDALAAAREARERLEIVEREMVEVRARMEAMEGELKAATSGAAEAVALRKTLRAAEEAAAAAAREVKDARDAASREADDAAKLRAALSEARMKVEAAEREAESLRRAAEQTTNGAESRVMELTVELDGKAAKLQSLEAELLALSSAAEEEKAALAQENVRMANKLDESRRALEAMEKEKEVYAVECERAIRENEEMKRSLEESQQRWHESEARGVSSAQEVHRTKELEASLAEALATADEAANAARENLAKYSEETKRVGALQGRLEIAEREFREKLASVEAALKAERAKTSSPPSIPDEVIGLRQQVDAANKQIAQLQNLLSDARASKVATNSFTNKKNEDFSETDIEGAVLTGGSYAFVPLQGHLKSATSAPVLQHPVALQIAANFDRASVYLQRRPIVRLALSVWVIFVHLWLLL